MEYQNIDFGDVKIKGKDREPEYRVIFPEPPVGKSILDVGCNLGYYCFQAASEGARECVGIDNHSAFIETANTVKGFKNVRFVVANILEELPEPFDIVLMLYVFHHFNNIEKAVKSIKRCYDLANELVVFGVLDWTYHISPWGFHTNSKGNKKLAFTIAFFEEMYPDDKIEVFESALVEGRSIIKIWKK